MGPPREEAHFRCGGLGPRLGPGLLLSSGENPIVLNGNWPGEGQSGSWPGEGQGLLKAKKQMKCKIANKQMPTHFAWEVSGRLEVPASQKGFSCCHCHPDSPPWVLEVTCCAELHNKVYRLNM